MHLKKAVGTLQNINGASVYIGNLAQFKTSGAVIPAWHAGSLISPLEKLQNDAIQLHGEFSQSMARIKENADLTREAKIRQTGDLLTTFLAAIETSLPQINEAAAAAFSVAQQQMKPAVPLAQGDSMQAVLDTEARAFLRSLGRQERDALTLEMTRGEHPEVTASVLRGPAILSGLAPAMHTNLAAAGIANNHPVGVMQLALFAGTLRDLTWMISTLAKNLIGKAVEPGSSVNGRVETWLSATPAIAELIEWLRPIPMEMEGDTPKAPKEVEAAA